MNERNYRTRMRVEGTLVALVAGLLLLSACRNQSMPTTTITAPTIAQTATTVQPPAAGQTGVATGPGGGGGSSSAQITKGQGIYTQKCAKCHGQKGEGVSAPAVIGSSAGLSGYGSNAQDVFKFIKAFMPRDNPGTLSDDDAWAVLAYILNQNGLYQGPEALGSDNAAGIPLRPR